MDRLDERRADADPAPHQSTGAVGSDREPPTRPRNVSSLRHAPRGGPLSAVQAHGVLRLRRAMATGKCDRVSDVSGRHPAEMHLHGRHRRLRRGPPDHARDPTVDATLVAGGQSTIVPTTVEPNPVANETEQTPTPRLRTGNLTIATPAASLTYMLCMRKIITPLDWMLR